MNIFVTSDCHFGHKRILEYESKTRQFSSIEEMDEKLIDNWNGLVKPTDEIYILGDLSFHKLNKTVEILNRLNGKKCCISGNHDSHLIKHQEFIDCFEGRLFDLLDHKINGTYYVMCHYPMLSWNRSHYGAINLFGHLHSSWKGNKQQLNVGMDCHNLCPINIEEVSVLLSELPDKDFSWFSGKRNA